MSEFFDEDNKGMVWTATGGRYRTGKAGQRCLRDVIREYGDEAGVRTARKASRLSAEVTKTRFPDTRSPVVSQQEIGVSVEAVLLAGGLDDAAVKRLAKEYRRGKGASVELASLGFYPPSSSTSFEALRSRQRRARKTCMTSVPGRTSAHSCSATISSWS